MSETEAVRQGARDAIYNCCGCSRKAAAETVKDLSDDQCGRIVDIANQAATDIKAITPAAQPLDDETDEQ